MFLRDTNFPSVALFFLFTGFSHDGIGFCFGGSRRDRFFLGRAFVPVVFLTTESVFVLGVHDEMPFCFSGSRRMTERETFCPNFLSELSVRTILPRHLFRVNPLGVSNENDCQ